MPETFLTFQKFNDAGLANEIAERLRQSNIEYQLEDNNKIFDPSFANNTFEPDINLKIKPEDFSNADKALEAYYKASLAETDKDYYLFEFSDDELVEIIAKPDEWGRFDYQLAQKILSDRGKEVNPEIAGMLKTQRIKELAKREIVHSYWIYAGYIFAIVGGLFGIIIGWTLAYFKKTLPDGTRINAYSVKDRNHGTRILLLSIIGLIGWIFIRLYMVADQ